jgi:hypothetical protein
MFQLIYTAFTAYEGVYIFYLLPVVYFVVIVFSVIFSKHKLRQPIKIKDVMAMVAIVLIFLDFGNYLYLFLTKTGELLPPSYLLIKYVIGFFLWLWTFWYSYKGYFARRTAGEQGRKRQLGLVWMGVGSLVLAFVGIIIS